MITRHQQIYLCYIIVILAVCIRDIQSDLKVIYAVNCGGDDHVDSNGIHYKRDPLHGKIGTASDYGRRLLIGRVPTEDQILYQTERYHDGNFGYHLPIKEDGDYVLVLKFSEVYFNAVNKKVFHVRLNDQHMVIGHLDIYAKVGRGVAHDEYIQMSVSNGHLYLGGGHDSIIKGGSMYMDFVKGPEDNPKINAFYLVQGTLDDVFLLPPMPSEAPEEEYKEDVVENESKRNRRTSGPAVPDPYSQDDTSMMLPIFIAIAAVIPISFCLCKL